MSKVLLVVAHPDLSQSKANAALVDAVRDLPHVTVHDLYATYPDFQIDVKAEQALLAEHDVIVFQHPVFWYNTTPLFKQWQDKVLTLGWAFTIDGSASQLAGKKAVVAVTAGVPADYYTPEGAERDDPRDPPQQLGRDPAAVPVRHPADGQAVRNRIRPLRRGPGLWPASSTPSCSTSVRRLTRGDPGRPAVVPSQVGRPGWAPSSRASA